MGACPHVSTWLQGPKREPQRATEWQWAWAKPRKFDWFLGGNFAGFLDLFLEGG